MGVRVPGVAPLKHVVHGCLDHDARGAVPGQFLEFFGEAGAPVDDGVDEVLQAFALDRDFGFAPVDRVVPRGEGATDNRRALESVGVLFARVDDDR